MMVKKLCQSPRFQESVEMGKLAFTETLRLQWLSSRELSKKPGQAICIGQPKLILSYLTLYPIAAS